MSELLVRKGLGGLLGAIPETESTPPLWYLIAWGWTRVFGTDEAGLRSLSALVGTATVPVAYLAAATLVSRRAGLVAAVLVAVHPLLVWYSQEARAYALLIFLTSLALLFFARVLERASGGPLAAWAATSVLALATHYFAFFAVAPQAAWLLLARRGRSTWAAVSGVVAGGAALLPLVIAQRESGNPSWIADVPLASRLRELVKQFLVGKTAPADRAAAGAALILVAVAAWLLLRRAASRERAGAMPALAVGLVALLAPLVLSFGPFDYLDTQNALPALVPLLIAVAAGLGARRAGSIGTVVTSAFVVLSIALVVSAASDGRYQRDDWRGAARALARAETQRLIVLTPDLGAWYARVPFQLYLPDARAVDEGLERTEPSLPALSRRPQDHAAPSRVRTQEVVLLGVDRFLGHVESPPALPGFREAEQRSTGTYTLVRLRSPRPRLVAPRDLVRLGLGGRLAAVLLQPGPTT